jgi:two-component sensor histidine kinase
MRHIPSWKWPSLNLFQAAFFPKTETQNLRNIMRRFVSFFSTFLLAIALTAQTWDLSGHWKNEAGIGGNWAQQHRKVWFVSINEQWKEFFEGEIRPPDRIEGRLVKINLHTWERLELRIEMTHSNKDEIVISGSPQQDSSYTSSTKLSFAGTYAAYENIPRPVFDEAHRRFEVKTWFQDADTIATILFNKDNDPIFDKGLFIRPDSIQIIRVIKWSPRPCYAIEVIHCKLEPDGLIRAKARNVDGKCMLGIDYAWGSATYLRYLPDGILIPTEDRIDAREVPIPADILGLKIHSVKVSGQAKTMAPGRSISVKEGREIAFQFSCSVAGIRLYFRLEGYDAGWQDGSPENTAHYAGLPNGDYTFKVTTDPERLNVEGNTIAVSLRVFRPFYQRGWFFALASSFAALCIGLVFRWRELERRRLEQLRQRIARELHDDIGSTLSSISMLTSAAKNRTQEPSANIQLDTIGRKAQEALDNIGDILWAMRREDISGEELVQRMKAFALEILEACEIDVDFLLSGDADAFPLSAEQRKEIYLLFKEAVNNAAKYSGASEVHIGLHTQNDRLYLDIRDNGRGFDPATVQRGNGLTNMQRRAERLGGALRIESAPGGGTRIRLEV